MTNLEKYRPLIINLINEKSMWTTSDTIMELIEKFNIDTNSPNSFCEDLIKWMLKEG